MDQLHDRPTLAAKQSRLARSPADVARIDALESALKEALDYIDAPTDTPGPTLIVLAGRKLLGE